MFQNTYSGKRVLVTGHTGFKGSWLTEWLLHLGSEVIGVALVPETRPSIFEILGLEKRISRHIVADITNPETLRKVIKEFQPEVFFHLAAQPLVRRSYKEPLSTWMTNVMGTVHLLEALRENPAVKAGVIVTSDKCYENHEWPWGYREIDAMGGHDPYSSSKGAAELAVASWRRSFFQGEASCRIATGRAGNVIGGGDWAPDRIVVDFVRAIEEKQPIRIRNPQATRPWQHVLEPLSGYLLLGRKLLEPGGNAFAEAWNFGPAEESVKTVAHLAQELVDIWRKGAIEIVGNQNHPHEAGLLKLDVSKAASLLSWRSVWGFNETVRQTVHWYKSHTEGKDMQVVTREQLEAFSRKAVEIGIGKGGSNS